MISALLAILLHLFSGGGAQPASTHGGIFVSHSNPNSTFGGIF